MAETRHTTVTVTQTTTSGGMLDMAYYRGIPGLLKLLETLFSLIAYLCVECAYVYCIGYKAVDGFFKFVFSAAFTQALTLWMLQLFRITKPTLAHVEVVMYVVMVLCCLIADIVLSMHLCTSRQEAGVAFGWGAFIVFVVDLIFAIKRWLEFRQGS